MNGLIVFRYRYPEYQFLSNFYPCKVTCNGQDFPLGVEQFYAFSKASLVFRSDPAKRREVRADILRARTAAECKSLAKVDRMEFLNDGRRNPSFKKRFVNDGEKFKECGVVIMLSGLYRKFNQNIELRDNLLSTGDAILVEEGDVFWGGGASREELILLFNVDGGPLLFPGKNILGKLLMNVRSDIQARLHPNVSLGPAVQPFLRQSLVGGDSMIQDVEVAPMAYKFVWRGGGIEVFFEILGFCLCDFMTTVIMHAGTNDLQFFGKHDAADPRKMERMPNSMQTLKQLLQAGLINVRNSPDRNPQLELFFSDIIFRHCDPPLLARVNEMVPLSKIQRAGRKVNEYVSSTQFLSPNEEVNSARLHFNFLRSIHHEFDWNELLFQYDDDVFPGLHLNDDGATALQHEFWAVLRR